MSAPGDGPIEEPVSLSSASAVSEYEEVDQADVASVRSQPGIKGLKDDEDEEAPNVPTKLASMPSGRPSSSPPGKDSKEPKDGKDDDKGARDKRLGEVLVGRYRLDKLIGKGGMGRVYLATQFPLNRSVAVKILSPEFQRKDPQFVRRFFLEAATAARLTHPNTITVFDYGETERGELFIAMEYLNGRPLSRVLSAEGPLQAERAIHISMQIIRALREAHGKGIIHRDLKPGNIMLLEEGDDADYAKVLDFGLVKLFNTEGQDLAQELLTPSAVDAELTRAGMFLGSPKYMSPEQIQGHDLDPRTDIYSLGVILFQMLAGRPPFRGATSVEVIYKHVNHPVPAIHELNPEADCPPELERVVQRCLSKDREDRFASMTDLLAAMKDVRRAIIGVSSQSESSLDLAHIRPRDTTDPSIVPSNPNLSPHLTPKLSSIPARNVSVVPRASNAPDKRPPTPATAQAVAAFVDPSLTTADSSQSGPLNESRASDPPKLQRAGGGAKALPYALVGFLVAAAGGFAWVASRPEPKVIAPAPQAPVEAPAVAKHAVEPAPSPATPSLAKVSFRSKPDRAKVYEDDELIGTTPFEREIPRGADAPASRTFVFRLDGYTDETVTAAVDSDSLKILASLRVAPTVAEVKKPAPQPVKKPAQRPATPQEEYKENPY